MPDNLSIQRTSASAEQTEAYGEHIGRQLRGGEIIELMSDLGGGKTTFVRGLARGMGSDGHVTSPTFKISNVYKSKQLELQHFDFYRLQEAGIVADEVAEVLGDPQTVVVIEWGDVVHDVLPAERVIITIQRTAEYNRTLTLSYPAQLAYLVKDIQ